MKISMASNEKYTPSFEFVLDDPTLATTSGFSLVINIYNLDNKEAGVSDIKILGTVDGEVLPVAKCNFEADGFRPKMAVA